MARVTGKGNADNGGWRRDQPLHWDRRKQAVHFHLWPSCCCVIDSHCCLLVLQQDKLCASKCMGVIQAHASAMLCQGSHSNTKQSHYSREARGAIGSRNSVCTTGIDALLSHARHVAVGGRRQEEAPICCEGQVVDLMPIPRAQQLPVHAVLILHITQDPAIRACPCQFQSTGHDFIVALVPAWYHRDA